ncbi:HAMP domain-containing protein [Clostridium sp. 'deep sea']|uniref:methyl-accepting chemotaxis protein n=1 Tax=Clostridium sp. 'deep sea' TaxID=2779445 RepID=UPI001896883E|nr:methyl-accepting chemotaxis protein [Clostridium sp. 'deep sea']QOR35330.1 HAMP domain-containing protein [Clostridium sp. 'deep sea']
MLWLKDLKIATKLRMLVAVGLIVVLVMCGVTYYSLNDLKTLQEKNYAGSSIAIYATEGSSIGARLYQVIADSIINRDIEESEVLWQSEKVKALELINKIKNNSISEEDLKLINEAKLALEDLIDIYENKMLPALSKTKYTTTEIKNLHSDLDNKFKQIQVPLASITAKMNGNMQALGDEFTNTSKALMKKLIYLSVIAIFLMVGLSLLIINLIIKPISVLVDVSNKLAKGDVNIGVEQITKDEVGILTGAFAQIVENIHLQSEIAESISNGDLSMEIVPKSEGDILSKSMKKIVETLNDLVTETGKLTTSAIQGDLDTRANITLFNGVYEDIVYGVNQTLDAIMIPIEESLEALSELAEGNLDARVDGDYRGDFARIQDSVNTTASEIQNYIKEISTVLDQIANNNLDVEINSNFLGDFKQLRDSINTIINSLNQIIGEIQESSGHVESGAREVSNASQNLSNGAAEQASSVEEMSATITEVAEQTRENANNANQANEIATTAKAMAEEGNEQMKDMLEAMEEMNIASKNIGKIIKVIDDIAFQTNILALNAAVEAARAGEHGKGFAVVAEEVRSLAARSAEAAKETTDLIDTSIKKVKDGTQMAAETASALAEIVNGITDVSVIVDDIANASNEQASAIAQINDGIMQISTVTQSNTSTAEESASASEQMAAQAEYLQNLLQKFVTKATINAHKIELVTATKAVAATSDVVNNKDLEITLDDEEFGKY